jgi:hypothetical protein
VPLVHTTGTIYTDVMANPKDVGPSSQGPGIEAGRTTWRPEAME